MPSLCLSKKFSLDPEVDATKGAEIHIRRLQTTANHNVPIPLEPVELEDV